MGVISRMGGLKPGVEIDKYRITQNRMAIIYKQFALSIHYACMHASGAVCCMNES